MAATNRKLASLVMAGVMTASAAVPAIAAGAGQGGQKADAAQTQAQPQTQTQDQRVPDTKVKSFAAAASDVQVIAKEYRPKIKAAKQDGKNKKAREHAAQAQREMKKVIEKQDGISVKEYQDITRKARQNKELTKRIRNEISDGGAEAGSNSQS